MRCLALFALTWSCSSANESPSSLAVLPAQLRQGQDSAHVVVTRPGNGLENAELVNAADLTLGRVEASNDAQLELVLSVPHGAALGPRSLELRTADGAVQQLSLEVTAISASPTGDDGASGTRSEPFATFAQALSVSDAGDTVQLAAGNYDEPTQTLVHSLNLRGESAASTSLRGGLDVAECPACTLSVSATTLVGDGTEPALSVARSSNPTRLSLEDVGIEGGLLVEDVFASVTVRGATLTGSTENAAVNFQGSELSIASSTIRAGESAYGISLRLGSLSLSDVTIQGGSYSIYQIYGDAKLRRSHLEGYRSIGFYYASGTLDLGSETEAGDNAFVPDAANAEAFAMYVNTGAAPVTSSNTSFNGVMPAAGTVTAQTSEIAIPGEYFLNPGQTIRFYRVGL